MLSWKEPVKSWFGYTRRERRASFILLIIILIITGIRYLVPARSMSIEKIPIDPAAVQPVKSSVPVRKGVTYNAKKPVASAGQRRLIDLNTCDSLTLKTLPGIGPVLSARIIKYRNLIGGFGHVEQLMEVYGLKEETYVMIASRVRADSLSVRKIKINSVTYKDLIRHPYFSQKEVSDIMKFRELKGRITGINDIRENNLLTSETLRKIRIYLDFGD